jgi:2-aminoadipate transaminase
MVSKIAEKSKVTRVISFAAGDPDPDVIPRALYANLAKRVFEEERKSVIYSPTEGIPELREEIARFMGMYEGVEASPSDIIVTVGGSQALDLIGKLMIDPGDIVIVENPSYVNTLLVWKPYGVRLIGIPMDENGMDTHLLESKLRELKADGKFPKLIYTIPTGQNPTGITMSLDRRKHLYEIASQYDLLIVEDGAYNHLVYEQVEVKSIKSMDVEGRVIFVGSFSKVLGTGLRVGWLHLPRELVDVFKAAKGPADMCAPVPSQLIVYRILREGLFKEIKENAIKAYKEKRDLMLDAIDKYLHGVKHTHPVAGMFIFLWLPEHIDAWRLAEEVLEKKAVATIPGAPFYTDQTGRNTLRLNFSMAPKDLIDKGVRDLSEFIK